MPIVVVSGTSQMRGSGRRSAPILAMKGIRRKAVKKLLAALKTVQGQDQRELVASQAKGWVPYLFTKSQGSPIETAVHRLIERCEQALAMKS